MQELAVKGPTIRLGQLLKFASLAEDGGQAKDFLEAGIVTVNGEREERRGRQLVDGDVVAVEGAEQITVRIES